MAALMEQLTQVRGDLSLVRDSQTEIKDDVELMQNKLPNDMDVKMQLIIQVSYLHTCHTIPTQLPVYICLESACYPWSNSLLTQFSLNCELMRME